MLATRPYHAELDPILVTYKLQPHIALKKCVALFLKTLNEQNYVKMHSCFLMGLSKDDRKYWKELQNQLGNSQDKTDAEILLMAYHYTYIDDRYRTIATQLLNQLIEKSNNSIAMIILGDILCTSNTKAAETWYISAKESAFSASNLAYFYNERGKRALAGSYYKKISEMKCDDLFTLSILSQHTLTIKDYNTASQYLTQGAMRGYTPFLLELGDMYLTNNGVQQDTHRAAVYYRTVIENSRKSAIRDQAEDKLLSLKQSTNSLFVQYQFAMTRDAGDLLTVLAHTNSREFLDCVSHSGDAWHEVIDKLQHDKDLLLELCSHMLERIYTSINNKNLALIILDYLVPESASDTIFDYESRKFENSISAYIAMRKVKRNTIEEQRGKDTWLWAQANPDVARNKKLP
jgi:hypothetical protein